MLLGKISVVHLECQDLKVSSTGSLLLTSDFLENKRGPYIVPISIL